MTIRLGKWTGKNLIPTLLILASQIARAQTPTTAKHPVADRFFDVTVVDDYQWLEKQDAPEVKAWSRAQDAYARRRLAAIPERDQFRSELSAVIGGGNVSYGDLKFAGALVFAVKNEPPRAQPRIIVRDNLKENAGERVVFDPVALDPSGGTSFDWYEPSPDGKYIALSISRAGSEAGDLRFVDTQDGRLLPGQIEHVQFATAGGSAAWTADGHGIFYTRYPRPGEYPEVEFYQQIYFHPFQEGAAAPDRYEIGKAFPKIAEIALKLSPGGRWLLATVADGDGGAFSHYLRGKNGTWRQITHFNDGIKQAEFGSDARLYLHSVRGAARGWILSLDLTEEQDLVPQAWIPESTDNSAITSIAASPDYLLVVDIRGGPTRVRLFDAQGRFQKELPLSPWDAVTSAEATPDGKFVLKVASYTRAARIQVYDPSTGLLQDCGLDQKTAVTFSDLRERRLEAVSQDGTKIPLSILFKAGTKLDGRNPTILYGYGGYGISLQPRFDLQWKPWIDRGGVYAIANLRGGGEFGEPWHEGGMLLRKQNVIDDFTVCAKKLIAEGWTSPEHLGVEGGSNGGITVGGFITQHPRMAAAAAIEVGVLDSLRSELEPNGLFNTTEYGSTHDQPQFSAIYSYSPYHHVESGIAYPAVLLTAGENDHRVASWHSKKMAAKLQAATNSGKPVLLTLSDTAGHGYGTSFEERVNDEADRYAFFYEQLRTQEKEDRSPK